MLLLSDEDVRALADMPSSIEAIERALEDQHEGTTVLPARLNLLLNGTFLRLMPVQLGRLNIMGFKSFHGSIEGGVRYVVILCRLSDGEILAIADAAYLTAFRTGATSGVATRHMAAEGPATVAVIGSGLEAETNLLGIAAVRPIEGVRVFSPRPTRREAFASRMATALGVSVRPATTPEAAISGAGIVVVATNTGNGGPVAFEGEWMRPGQHVVSIGSTGPTLREITLPPLHGRTGSSSMSRQITWHRSAGT
jgi:alanine dehydrogenase